MRFQWVNEDSLQVHLASPEQVASAMRQLRMHRNSEIRDLSAGFNQLLITFARPAAAQGLLSGLDLSDAPTVSPRLVTLPVCYDPTVAPDLTDVAQRTGLSVEDIIERHCQQRLTVVAMGFAPGFGYLDGLDPALSLPRKATPRSEVPAGSVAIANRQSVIYSTATPGGWHIIGRSPARLIEYEPALRTLFEIGDQVKFEPISLDQLNACK